MKETFAECGEVCYIELPLRANWGGKNVHIGENVWIGAGAWKDPDPFSSGM